MKPLGKPRTCAICGRVFTPARRSGVETCSRKCTATLILRRRGVTPLFDRFYDKVVKRGDDQCWEWRGATHLLYGQIYVQGEGAQPAHRVSYILHKGPIPAGMCVRHTCDNPPCTNPAHLELGTQRQNVGDMVAKSRQQRGERNGLVKLTASQVLEIREALAKGVSLRQLSGRYGVGQSTIHAIKSGRTWSHVA